LYLGIHSYHKKVLNFSLTIEKKTHQSFILHVGRKKFSKYLQVLNPKRKRQKHYIIANDIKKPIIQDGILNSQLYNIKKPNYTVWYVKVKSQLYGTGTGC
jgi:hypothetical protein